MQSSRRRFLEGSFLLSMVMITSGNKLFAAVTPLQTLSVVQKDLFENKMIDQSNAYAYIGFIFRHSRVNAQNKQFLRNGSKWLHEESVKLYNVVYTDLNAKQRQEVLKKISNSSWGDSWIRMVLKFILEATLGDPIYGINSNEAGWRWLKHTPGLPRPSKVYL